MNHMKDKSPLSHIWAKAIETEMAMIDDVPECCKEEVEQIIMENKSKHSTRSYHQPQSTFTPSPVYAPQVYNNGMGSHELTQARTLLESVVPSANGMDVPSHVNWTSQLNINKLKQAVTRAEKNPTETNMKSLRTHMDKFQRSLRSGSLAKAARY